MRFGIFYEHQLPRPWDGDSEERLIRDALEQVELADRVGIDNVWEVEHHFLEEYSHSSAPEVFLAAASQRTERIRLGHGIVQIPTPFNHPARVAERIGMLDLVSGGRVEFGTGESSSQAELGAFGVDRETKRAQWEESLDAITRMFVEDPFAGYDGQWLSMPPRGVHPKPKQKPHPPLWVACSRRETILLAAQKGIGALTFAFIEPEQAKEWVDEYHSILASERCVAGGFAVNPKVAVVLPMMLHPDEQTAIERGIDGAHFFGFSLAYYYVFGQHTPGVSNVWDEFQAKRADYGFAREIINADDAPLGVRVLQQGLGSLRGAIGTPAQVRDLIERYERVGVDQVIFVQQAGRNRHEDICESIELFGKEVLPHFTDGREEREAAKRERLAEACERALARREPARTADPGYLIEPTGEPRPAQVIAAARQVSANGAGAATADGATSRRRAALAQRLTEMGESAFARFVRGRSDAALERTVGSNPGLRIIFKSMERSFVPEMANGFTGDIQYELTRTANGRAPGDARVWVVHIRGSQAVAEPGHSEKPSVTFKASVPTFARIAAGQLHPAKAILEGDMEVYGDYQVAMRLPEMFGQQLLV
jgi:alkanesulfonate monooxygenase SsuD/methylene tetrahydromethanopterin reductase-like flavin-dependent oxidoreductase (luciferase family)/putative sterol carrier protein